MFVCLNVISRTCSVEQCTAGSIYVDVYVPGISCRYLVYIDMGTYVRMRIQTLRQRTPDICVRCNIPGKQGMTHYDLT